MPRFIRNVCLGIVATILGLAMQFLWLELFHA
jgi:hypothetical protein